MDKERAATNISQERKMLDHVCGLHQIPVSVC